MNNGGIRRILFWCAPTIGGALDFSKSSILNEPKISGVTICEHRRTKAVKRGGRRYRPRRRKITMDRPDHCVHKYPRGTLVRNGKTRDGKQMFRCLQCGHTRRGEHSSEYPDPNRSQS